MKITKATSLIKAIKNELKYIDVLLADTESKIKNADVLGLSADRAQGLKKYYDRKFAMKLAYQRDLNNLTEKRGDK